MRPLRERKLDIFYIVFCAVHLAATVLVDAQTFYDAPQFLKAIPADYLEKSNDPLLRFVHQPKGSWFYSFVVLEVVFQLPCFAIGIYGFYRDLPQIYPLMLAYSTCAATTVIGCMAHIFYGPEKDTLTASNVALLLQSYVPFLLAPLIMAIDMIYRLNKLIASSPISSKPKHQ